MRLAQLEAVWVAFALAAIACGGPQSHSADPHAAPSIASLASGGAHTCFADADGLVFCWGANEHAQLGSGLTGLRSEPLQVPGLSDVVEVTAGAAHSCARTRGGDLFCWGAGLRGQIGDGHDGEAHQSVPNPTRIVGLAAVTQVSAGAWHTCAVDVNERVSCWGDDATGQLGDGEPMGDRAAAPVELDLVSVHRVSAGTGHTCAVTADGTVRCWGDDTHGQLGDGQSGEGVRASFPVEVTLPEPAVDVVVGRSHSCALSGSGNVYCWGDNAYGQIGAAGPPLSPTPHLVDDVSDAVMITAGDDHGCAALRTGSIRCWGNNHFGQLGDGSFRDAARPTDAAAYGVRVAAGAGHTCALQESGAVVCWGDNASGQLGDGRVARRAYARAVTELREVRSIAAGGHHSCALRDDAVLCWGDNALGQLGDWTHAARSTPVPSAFLRAPQQLSLSLGRTCFRDAQGSAFCIGGTDESDGRPHAVTLDGRGSVSEIAAAPTFACARNEVGGVLCWGDNTHGQLGDGTSMSRESAAPVRGVDAAEEIALGDGHACARLSTGAVVCWGANNFGQLGDGTNESRDVPTAVVGIEDAVELALGRSHSCVRRRGGMVACWGANAAGQLGDGTSTAHPTAQLAMGLDGAEELSSGWLHTCARSSGHVLCWGDNRYGQLGRETEEPWTSHPGQVADVDDAIGVAAGGLHACALTRHHGVRCWGSNTHGQLGDGAILYSTRPVLAVVPH